MPRFRSWVRDVIADRGEHDPLPIDLERTPDGAYAFRLGVRAGFGVRDAARVPIERRTNPAPHPLLKEIHACEIAGRTLEAANVHALRRKVGTLLESLAPGRSLPLCYFRAPAMDYELPVYEEDGRIVSRILGGRTLRARDLGEMRRAMCRHLVSAGYVNEPDEVTVGVVRPSDLRLVPPAAVFRSPVDPDLWIPSVEGTSPEGPVVGVLGSPASLAAPGPPGRRFRTPRPAGPAPGEAAPSAPDVIALLRSVRAELDRRRAVSDPAAVFATAVRPDVWAHAAARTEDSGAHLVAYLSDEEATRLELTIRRTGAGDVAAALDGRGIDVFLAADDAALAARVGAHLAGQGFLRFAEEVEIHAAAAPRAERLDADTIRTFGGPGPAADEPEEVLTA